MESNHNKDFDRQVRKKFENFSVEVSSSLWATIEKEIEPEEAKTHKVFNLKSYRYIGAAAALLLIGFTIWRIQPEERIFLRGEVIVEETALVKEPEFKQSADDKINHTFVEKKNELVSTSVPRPVKVTVMNESEKEIEVISKREPLLVVNTPVERDNVSIIEESGITPSLNKTLDVRDEHLASLNQIEDVIETEPEERTKIVTGILNFVAANFHIGGEGKRVEFTENEHGIIKIELKR